MTNDRTTLLVRLREVTNASSDASGNPVRKLHTAEHGVLHTEPGASVGYSVENFLPRDAAERARGRLVALTLAANGRVVGIDRPRIGLPKAAPTLAVSDAAVEAFKAAWHLADAEGRTGERVRDGLAAALPHLGAAPSATREDVRDEIAGHPIGSGYYATSVGVDEAFEIADALLARFTITPRAVR